MSDVGTASRVVDRAWWLLVTSGGLGASPVAPGTVGTLGGVAVAIPIVLWVEDPMARVAWLAGSALVLLVVGCRATAYVDRAFPVKDPGAFVLDEVVGYLATIALMVPFFPGSPWLLLGLGFALFRVFDILKPWPVRPAERLPGAVGIMADDVVAGLLAGVCGGLAGWLQAA